MANYLTTPEGTEVPKFLQYGLQSNYDQIEVKEDHVLYFCTDTGKIYKGNIDFTNSVVVAGDTQQEADIVNPIVGKIYFFPVKRTLAIYTGGLWITISALLCTDLTDESQISNEHVVTSAALVDYLGEMQNNLDESAQNYVSTISSQDGVLSINEDMEAPYAREVELTGVVVTPTWDPATRKLTIPIVGAEGALEIDFGKDIFLDPEADNKYDPETNTINLYLNDSSDPEKAPTLIQIPAEGLINTIAKEDSSSATVTILNSNKIKVDVVVDETVEDNALVLKDTGLSVDLSVVTEKINTLRSDLNEIKDYLLYSFWGEF